MREKKLREVISDTVQITAEVSTDVISSFLDGSIAQILPGVVTMKMSWMQRRSERRILLLIDELKKRQTRLEQLILLLSNERLEQIKEYYVPELFEYSSVDKEEEKIELLVNGFESILKNNTQYSEYIDYMDVMNQLRISDIPILLQLEEEEMDSDGKDLDSVGAYKLNKLNQLGLAGYHLRFDGHKSYYITEFGKNFIRYFIELNN